MRTESTTAETFDGKPHKLGNLIVQPPKGTLKSFREENGGEPGETSRFVASFNTKTGEFVGYKWDGNMVDTYEDFSRDKRADLINQIQNQDNPYYEHYTSKRAARMSALNISLGVLLPSVFIKPLTIATATQKVFNASSALRSQVIKFANANRIFSSVPKNKMYSEIVTKYLTQMEQGVFNASLPEN